MPLNLLGFVGFSTSFLPFFHRISSPAVLLRVLAEAGKPCAGFPYGKTARHKTQDVER
jgi:hypothetical protein